MVTRSLIETHHIAKNATAPVLITRTIRKTDGTIQNVAGATVKFHMREEGGTLKINNASASIADSTGGRVSYTFASADTTSTGKFEAQFTITLSNGDVLKYPAGPAPITVVITEDVA